MSQQLTGKTYLQKLQTFAYVCLGIPLLFFIYLYLESSVERLVPLISEEQILYLFFPLLIVSILLVYAANKKFKSINSSAILETDFLRKLIAYQKANNTRFLYYGISTLLITIGFYITNFQPLAALFGIMIVLFSINNPNQRKIVKDLKLKDPEKTIILKGLEIP